MVDDERMQLIAGVDEAGRGPLAGPVVAAAVILHPTQTIPGLADSKVLSSQKRGALFGEIKDKSLCWSIGRAEVSEIDSINILQATLLAMQRAIEGLTTKPNQVLVDGNQCPVCCYPTTAIIKGDQLEACISAASILAKVTRDAEMVRMDEEYPDYGFAIHKGYPTKQHMQALVAKGPTPIHRTSYAPVKRAIERSQDFAVVAEE
jgi:ribonuclease HII